MQSNGLITSINDLNCMLMAFTIGLRCCIVLDAVNKILQGSAVIRQGIKFILLYFPIS